MSDDFNFDGKPSRARSSGGGGAAMNMWDMLSIVALIATACLVGYFALIFLNPDSSLNFLRPGAVVSGPQGPTATPTLLQLEATWTPSPTLAVTPSNTLPPTWTPIPTNTPFSLVPPTKTPKPTSTPKAPFSAASITQQDSTLYHPDLTCNWAGIGGAVVDAKNSPVIGMVIVLRGSLDNKLIEQQTVSGINPEYGPSGFEFKLGDAPIKTDKTLYIQLVDQSGLPLSDKIYISTSSECTKNLVLVRLKKNK
ncbi:MAG: hypothetical protein ABI904_10750 [Chloroflexota bacterium]